MQADKCDSQICNILCRLKYRGVAAIKLVQKKGTIIMSMRIESITLEETSCIRMWPQYFIADMSRRLGEEKRNVIFSSWWLETGDTFPMLWINYIISFHII